MRAARSAPRRSRRTCGSRYGRARQGACEDRILVSADTDFGMLLAREKLDRPSVLLIRKLAGRRAAEQAAVILANLETVAEDLDDGAVVVLTDEWVRVRRLPIGS